MIRTAAFAALITAAALIFGAGNVAEAEPGVPESLTGEAAARAEDGPEGAAAPDEEPGAPADIESRPLFTGESETSEDAAGGVPYLDMVRLAASLAAVLGLMVAAAWAFRKFVPRTAGMFRSGAMQVIARTYLGPKQTVSIISVPGRLLVVGSTQQSISTLAEISDPGEMEKILAMVERSSPRSASETFKNIMASVTGRGEDGGGAEEELARTVEDVSEKVALLSNRLEAYNEEVN